MHDGVADPVVPPDDTGGARGYPRYRQDLPHRRNIQTYSQVGLQLHGGPKI